MYNLLIQRGAKIFMCKVQVDQSGYTLLEALLQLLCLCMIAATIPLIIPWYEKTKEFMIGTNTAEFEVFLSEFRADLQKSEAIYVVNDQEIQLEQANETNPEKKYLSTYRFSKNRIIKTYGLGDGTDIKLVAVTKVHFSLEKELFTIQCKMGNDTIRRRTFVLSLK